MKVNKANTLMFSSVEDMNFLTYNVLSVLRFLDCSDGKKRKFKHYSKLAFILEFISNHELIWALDKDISSQNNRDKVLLSRAYSDGLARINSLKRVLFVLQQKGFVNFSDDAKEMWLIEGEELSSFFRDELFEYERNNTLKLKSRIQRLNVITTDSFLKAAFTDKGIKSWANL